LSGNENGVLVKKLRKSMKYYFFKAAYQSNAVFKCDILCSFSERRRGRNAGKKAAECCRIFGFDSPHANSFSMLWVRAAI